MTMVTSLHKVSFIYIVSCRNPENPLAGSFPNPDFLDILHQMEFSRVFYTLPLSGLHHLPSWVHLRLNPFKLYFVVHCLVQSSLNPLALIITL
jgi:hypothetical protein